jgi:hypothetical protein
MSHIPNSAMPHAGPPAQPQDDEGRQSYFGRDGHIAEKVRENKKASIAAGAAVVAGAIAAAAIPFLRARNTSGGKKNTGSRSKKAGAGRTSGSSRSKSSK